MRLVVLDFFFYFLIIVMFLIFERMVLLGWEELVLGMLRLRCFWKSSLVVVLLFIELLDLKELKFE